MSELGLMLQRAQRDFERRLNDELSGREHGLTPAQLSVIQHVDSDGTRLGAVADKVGTTKQAVGQIIDQLEKLGFVERGPDPADARARLVRPTKRGATLLTDAKGVSATIRKDWKKKLGADRLAALEDALGALFQD